MKTLKKDRIKQLEKALLQFKPEFMQDCFFNSAMERYIESSISKFYKNNSSVTNKDIDYCFNEMKILQDESDKYDPNDRYLVCGSKVVYGTQWECDFTQKVVKADNVEDAIAGCGLERIRSCEKVDNTYWRMHDIDVRKDKF
jgi:hypothetical protein